MPRNTDPDDTDSEPSGQKYVKKTSKESREHSKIDTVSASGKTTSASSKGRPEGSSQPPRRSGSPLKGNPPTDSTGATAKAPPSRPVQNNNEGRVKGLSIFRCFPGSGRRPPEGNPISGGLSQSDRIAAAAESGLIPNLPSTLEDRNQSRGKAPAESLEPREHNGNHPADHTARKAAATGGGVGASRKAADRPDALSRDPPRSASASKSGAVPRKPASSHGTPKGSSPAGTPKSTSRERIIVVPASATSQAQTNSTSPTRPVQQSSSSSKLAIACACNKEKGPVGQPWPGSQKSRVEAKMTRGGGSGSEMEMVNEPVGLRAPRRAGKEHMIQEGRQRSSSRNSRGNVEEIQERGSSSPGTRRRRRRPEGPSTSGLELREGDIILREKKRHGVKMIDFFYPGDDDDDMIPRKHDYLLRQTFQYSHQTDIMHLTSELWRALITLENRDGTEEEVLSWEFVDYASRSLRRFQADPVRPPFGPGFQLPDSDGGD